MPTSPSVPPASVRIERYTASDPGGDQRVLWRAKCSCGWAGPLVGSQYLVDLDVGTHGDRHRQFEAMVARGAQGRVHL